MDRSARTAAIIGGAAIVALLVWAFVTDFGLGVLLLIPAGFVVARFIGATKHPGPKLPPTERDLEMEQETLEHPVRVFVVYPLCMGLFGFAVGLAGNVWIAGYPFNRAVVLALPVVPYFMGATLLSAIFSRWQAGRRRNEQSMRERGDAA